MSDHEIGDDEVDVRYRQMIDSFIDQANTLAETDSPENVGMALLFAASRFNAFVVSQHAESLSAYEKDLEKARSFFSSQYLEMLDENLDDYKKIYNKYHQFVKQ
ncbi:MAG: DUF3144 domain-containing protein [Gammaproteobacteria bacterium]|nr:DUF3144 domain-containing protein [Gammaproteobacteria bacterium]